jgi:palmitoyltransferase
LDVDDEQDEYESEVEEGIDGEEGWTNAEGDRLRDFGVDEDAELLAEEDVPLGELLRRRKARAFT